MFKVNIKYTSFKLPPPFAHEYIFNIEQKRDSLKVALTQSYIGREDLTLEEIEEEGFTANDNASWNGDLPIIWKNYFHKIKSETVNLNEKPPHLEEVEVIINTNNNIKSFNNSKWTLVVQELYQACLEAAQLEAPLKINLIKTYNQITVRYELIMSFEFLKCTLFRQTSMDKKFIEIIWEKGQEFSNKIFSIDFSDGKSYNKIPKYNGIWIETGDNLWYSFHENQAENKQHIILDEFDSLFKA